MLKTKIEKYHYIAFIGWIAKLFAILLSLLNTRMLLNLINIDGYALYSILASFAGWIALLNFGLPNGVQNLIAKYRVKNKNLDNLYKSLFFLIVIILMLSVPLLYIVSFAIYHTILSSYQNLISTTMLFAVLYLLLLFGLSQIFYKILFANYKGIYPNLYPLIISAINFLILYLCQVFNMHNEALVIVLFFSSYFIIFIVSYLQSIGIVLPKFDRVLSIELFKYSKDFFIFAILASFTLGIDYIIMSKILDSLYITQYNLIMKFYNLIIVLYATLLATSWSISSEAYHKKEYFSIYELIKKNIIIGLLLTIIVSIIVFTFKDQLFFLVSGKELHILYTTLLLATIYVIIRIWTDTFATILSSIQKVKILICVVPYQAFISILSQFYLGKKFGINGIFIGLILSFLLTVSIILPLYLKRHLREQYD
ncbi:Na+-driven multidrug efflux pump [Desulfonauticus submarinus]|uniref:Na+-driven multidrug efflux pump n=1 Tax=Desulfonauticus submarinus TaxID=206665 RepID=A0A1H0BZ21_9BACT|nr:MATE family efflux transporter [Desulfonauticus submarinus]SDN50941.1 Na+-driven multidrug efflux pump [Desulfonauticus submarinus]